MNVVEEMVRHAAESTREEVCGLVAKSPRGVRLVRDRNVSDQKINSFVMSGDAWLELADDEEAIAIYHSHVLVGPEPSMADRAQCEATRLPWHIVTHEGHHYYFEPCGYVAPLLERPYVYLVHDCYTLVRDWYRMHRGIELPEFHRPANFWDKGLNVIEESFEAAGFVRLTDQVPQVGDVFLMKVAARLTNHCAIYVGNGKILHHVGNRLSKEDLLDGYWAKHVCHHVRHIDAIAK